MASRGDMIKRARARVDARRASRNREDYMATQGRNIVRKDPGEDARRGFLGDLAQMGREDLVTMGGDLRKKFISDPAKKYLPSIWGGGMRGLDALTGAWDEAQEARRDDKKWTLGGDPLDITRGSDAYKYLLTQIDPEYKDDFRREVGKDNLHWTELNEYAGDNAPGLAKKINEYNAGIRSFPKGEDIYEDLIGQGKALRDTGMLGDAAADQAEWLTRTGQPFDERQRYPAAYSPLEAMTIEDTMPTGGPPFLGGQNFGRGVAPMSPEESAFQMLLARDMDEREKARINAIDDFVPTPPGDYGVETEYTGHVPPNPTIDEIAGTEYPVTPPPFLSGDMDWFTPEPEEKELIPRGLEELMIDQYGVDAPGVPREREWTNTPPPGYQPPPPWYSRAWDWMKEGDWPTH